MEGVREGDELGETLFDLRDCVEDSSMLELEDLEFVEEGGVADKSGDCLARYLQVVELNDC